MTDTYNLADLQADIGISNDQAVFTDAEIARLWERAGEVHNITVYYAFRQLLSSAVKFVDYTSGLTSEKASQRYHQIKDSLGFWRGETVEEESQVEVMGLTQVPRRKKDKPWRDRNNKRYMLNVYYTGYDEEY